MPSPSDPGNSAGDRVIRVPLARIHPCPFQPRTDFPADSLRELADSIKSQGIVQPLIVRERNGQLELIAGERRWRAAQLAGLDQVPVIVRNEDDRGVLELALIENLQRENLNPIEEALGYAQLVGKFQLTQDEVATKVGKSRAVVANALRLLKLNAEIQRFIREGSLSVGHGKVILALPSSESQASAARRIIKEGLNVRQTEALVAHILSRQNAPAITNPPHPAAANAHVASLENKVRERLGTKVHLRYAQGKGSLEIRFFSDDELERVLQILGINPD